MLDLYVERWVNEDGTTYPWSVWLDGRQMQSSHQMGRYDDPAAAESDGRQFCKEVLKREPDRVSRL